MAFSWFGKFDFSFCSGLVIESSCFCLITSGSWEVLIGGVHSEEVCPTPEYHSLAASSEARFLKAAGDLFFLTITQPLPTTYCSLFSSGSRGGIKLGGNVGRSEMNEMGK